MSERLTDHIDQLQSVIQEIRDAILDLHETTATGSPSLVSMDDELVINVNDDGIGIPTTIAR